MHLKTGSGERWLPKHAGPELRIVPPLPLEGFV